MSSRRARWCAINGTERERERTLSRRAQYWRRKHSVIKGKRREGGTESGKGGYNRFNAAENRQRVARIVRPPVQRLLCLIAARHDDITTQRPPECRSLRRVSERTAERRESADNGGANSAKIDNTAIGSLQPPGWHRYQSMIKRHPRD